MEAVLLIGTQASGKSSFYRARYFRTHVRISLDQLRTRARERGLLAFCTETHQPFVVDNTNPSRAERAVYIEAARSAGFRIVGDFLQSRIDDCLERNAARGEEERVPEAGVRGTHGRLEMPRLDEGFDELHFVEADGCGGFRESPWEEDQ